MKTIRVYIAAAIAVAIFLSYVAGVRIGVIRCKMHLADTVMEQISINTKIMEKTNEVVLHTGGADIRRILREKYTITE